MKKFLVSVLLLPVLSVAQEPVIVEKPVVCDKIEIILNSLTKEFSEKPIWLGESSDSKYSVFVSKSGAWTIIQFTDRIACIIGVGETSGQIFSGPAT
jgi:hypothetical protein